MAQRRSRTPHPLPLPVLQYIIADAMSVLRSVSCVCYLWNVCDCFSNEERNYYSYSVVSVPLRLLQCPGKHNGTSKASQSNIYVCIIVVLLFNIFHIIQNALSQ
jgi:hypothetical protein